MAVPAFQRNSLQVSRSFKGTGLLKYHRFGTINDNMAASGSPSNDIVARKKAFRKKIRAAIQELSPRDIELQSRMVWDKVVGLPVYQSAKSVGLFLSMPSGEINTDFILQHSIENGKDVYVPQVGTNFEKCDMELLKVILGSPDPYFHKKWPRNKWDIPEPPIDMLRVIANPGDLDLLIVPGLGFDSRGNRLGQGKGYYDRFITRMTQDNIQLPLVAVALEAQFVDDDIPVETYDRQMDMVVLPSRIIIADKN